MAIIQSYGLFWSVDDVYWGKGSQAGSLLGVPARARTSEPCDFRQQVGIYVLYWDFDLVYVGQTGAKNQKLFRRLRKHRRDELAGRWNRFSWFGLRRVLSNGNLSSEKLRAGASLGTALDHIEAVMIAATEPTLNRQGGRFGKEKGIYKYLQCRDPRLGPTDDQMLRDVWSHLSGE
ncbi:MAG: GIY-YIG nuclease family protein [Planctomycetota bacterium]